MMMHFTEHRHAPSAKSFACAESLTVAGFLEWVKRVVDLEFHLQ